MNTSEERNEIERMENEGGKSAWWNDTTRNDYFNNSATLSERAANAERMLAEHKTRQAGFTKAFERLLAVQKVRQARENLKAVQARYKSAPPKFKPYLAYSYGGQGWVEVVSEACGQPPRRLCKWPTCDATFLVPDSLLQGEPPKGD